MVAKNEIYEVTIEDIGTEGQGIGHIDGEAVFVKDTLPGDRATVKIIKTKKNLAYGRLMEVLEPSESRTEPLCSVARACGGCTLQHMDYNAQLKFKWNKVKELLKRVGGVDEPDRLMEYVSVDGAVQAGSEEGRVNLKPEDDSINDDGGAHTKSEYSACSDKNLRKLAYGLKYPYHYRNKMQFPVGLDKEGKAVLGFYAGRTHSIIPLTDCVIGHPVNKYIIKSVKEYIDKYKVSVYDEEKHNGLIRHVLTRVGFHTNELMVCLVVNGDNIPHSDELYEMLLRAVDEYNKREAGTGEHDAISARTAGTDKPDENCTMGDAITITDNFGAGKIGMGSDRKITLRSLMININKDKTNRILGFSSKVIKGEAFISDYIGDIKFNISPESFFQVNPEMTEKLYGKALEYAELSGGEKVWDMYCGIGTISLFLAGKASHVFGVEIVPQAIEDARENAKLNEITNAEFYVGKAEEVVPSLYSEDPDKYRADVVVVDPPRKGCDEKLLQTLVKMAPKKLVYVSCDPATLARDIKYLSDNGFTLRKAAVFDQFSHGVHVETCCLLERI